MSKMNSIVLFHLNHKKSGDGGVRGRGKLGFGVKP